MSVFNKKDACVNPSEKTEPCYICTCPHGQYRSAMVFAWFCTVSAFICQIAYGCVSASTALGDLNMWVHLAFSIFFYGLLSAVLVKITMGHKILPERVYKVTVDYLSLYTALAGLLSIKSIVYDTIGIYLSRGEINAWALVLCYVLHLISLFLLFAARLALTGLPWEKQREI